MNNFKFGQASFAHLIDVHPDLVKVARRALEITPYDFGIVCGIRSMAEQIKLSKSGATTTLRSLHLLQPDGYSHAIDIVVFVNGANVYTLHKACQITGAAMHGYFRKVIQAFFTAAIECGTQIEAGGLWRTFIDGPHFQLNQKYYGVDKQQRNEI